MISQDSSQQAISEVWGSRKLYVNFWLLRIGALHLGVVQGPMA